MPSLSPKASIWTPSSLHIKYDANPAFPNRFSDEGLTTPTVWRILNDKVTHSAGGCATEDVYRLYSLGFDERSALSAC